MSMKRISNKQGAIWTGVKDGMIQIRQSTDIILIDPASLEALIQALQTIKSSLTTK